MALNVDRVRANLSLYAAAMAIVVVFVVMTTKSGKLVAPLEPHATCNRSSADDVVALVQRNAALRAELAQMRAELIDAIPAHRKKIVAAASRTASLAAVSANLSAVAALAGERFESTLLAALHRAALAEATAAGRSLDGFIRGNRRRAHAQVVAMPIVRTVCEVGFNFGFAAAVWLMANDNLRVLSFDLLEADAPWKRHSIARLHALFGADRLRVVPGNSSRTVEAFAASQRANVSCDVVHVDGDHRGDAPLHDLLAMRSLAHPATIVLIDDVGTCGYCRDPAAAWTAAIERNIVRQLACFDTTVDADDTPLTDVDRGHQFCIGLYV